MIKFNNQIKYQCYFGDGTLKIENIYKDIDCTNQAINKITWLYDNDSELFTLQCLVDHIRECRPRNLIYLEMPYIPNARQDRKVSNRLFTLKTFANIINAMNFDKVIVLDPHSDVSCALLNKLEVNYDVAWYWDERFNINDDFVYMFPDNGAAKKYSEKLLRKPTTYIIGNKHRNSEGRIDSYELINFQPGTEKVVIIDDICSFGGTYVAAAKALREQGVKQIDLVVSHCEPNIFKGDVFDYIDKVYTTDSILDLDRFDYELPDINVSNRIEFIKKYREIKE